MEADNKGLQQVTRFVDTDTVEGSDGGPSFRLQGFDAPETTKFAKDDSGNIYVNTGTAGGDGAFRAIEDVAREGGYTYVKDVGTPAAFGRRTGRLVNEAGDDFITNLYLGGVFRPDPNYATENDIEDFAMGEFVGSSMRTTEHAKEFDALSNEVYQAMLDEGYDPGDLKDVAVDEQDYAQNPSAFIQDVVKYRRKDRTIDNKAVNPFRSSFGAAMEGMAESSYGMASMMGSVLGIDSLERYGENNVFRKRYEISDRPTVLLDYKDVNSAGTFFDFLSNNFAMSVPYFGMIAASTLAAPFTMGASYAVPASIYTGGIWNEQEGKNKNAAVALVGGILQATLDRLGVTSVFNVSNLANPKEIVDKAIKAYSKDKNVPIEKATADVLKMSKVQVARLLVDSGDVIKDQIRSRAQVGRILKNMGIAGASEGGTEALQEAIGYVAAHARDDVFNFNEMSDRMINGALAGASLGGGFGAASGLWNQARWENALWSTSRADGSEISNDGVYAEEVAKKNNGKVPSNAENAERVRRGINKAYMQNSNFRARAERGDALKDSGTIGEKVWKAAASFPALYRGAARWVFTDDMIQKSEAIRELRSMFGGALQRVYSGADFEDFKHMLVAKFENSVGGGNARQFYAKFSNGARVTNKFRRQVSKDLYTILQASVDSKGNYDASAVEGAIKKVGLPSYLKNLKDIQQLGTELDALSDKMLIQQRKYNPSLNKLNNYLARFKSLNKAKVNANPERFKKLLVDNYDWIDVEKANEIVKGILENPMVADIDTFDDAIEAFSVTKGMPIPGSHRSRTLNLAQNPEFDDFMEQELFSNINYASKQAARYISYETFVGKNGSVINKLLDQALAEGLTEEEVALVASRLRDLLDAESGNYKRPTNENLKTLEKIQKNFITFTIFVGLPLATLSSVVELAITMKGLTNEQIFKKNGGLAVMGKELGNMFWNGAVELGSAITRKEFEFRESMAQEKLRELGFFDQNVGAATKTGVTETNELRQGILNEFFKWNGLQGWTQMTRAIRAGIATDFMLNHHDTIMLNPFEYKTKEVEQAEESLRNIGVDIDLLSKYRDKSNEIALRTEMEGAEPELTPQEQRLLEAGRQMMNDATFNFINEAIMLPKASNRPLLYQDPRFALFTQFQGFISVFTATFLPKLWGEYVKRGSPEMTYQAFSMMALMIVLGYASQELKDRVKYGGPTPYLDDFEKARRAVNSSGLLGTGERVINTIIPIYPQRTDGLIDYTWSEVSGQSPALTTLNNMGAGAVAALEGEPRRAANQLLKSTPIIGTVTQARQFVADEIGGDK